MAAAPMNAIGRYARGLSRSWMLLVCALAISALVLAACGDDDDEPDAGDVIPTATATEVATETATMAASPTTTATATATEDGGGAAGDAEETVSVELDEFTVTVDPEQVASGQITFEVENVGAIPHDFHAIRSSEEPDSLPVEGGVVNLEEVETVGEIDEDIPAGESESTTISMEPGDYILICNVPAHYQSGMYTAFTVN